MKLRACGGKFSAMLNILFLKSSSVQRLIAFVFLLFLSAFSKSVFRPRRFFFHFIIFIRNFVYYNAQTYRNKIPTHKRLTRDTRNLFVSADC